MSSPPLSAYSYNSPVAFFIGQTPPAGIEQEHPAAQGAFAELYNAMQQVITVFINNCGIGPQSTPLWSQLDGSSSTLQSGNLNRLYITVTEDIHFGAMITLFNSGGLLRAKNAIASAAATAADGFCTTPGGILAGQVGEVTLVHGIAAVTGLTPGQRYWLSSLVPGAVAATPALAAGNIEQYIGIAIDSEHLFVNAGYWIQH